MKNIHAYPIENQLEVYQSIVEVLPQSMFLMDKNKIIIGIFNASSESLAGYSADDILGNSILHYSNNPDSPFYELSSMLNSTFDAVLTTGVTLKFQYMIQDNYFEAIVALIPGDRILSQVHDITDIVLSQRDVDKKKHDELMMALTAGGLTSWSYDVNNDTFSSKQANNVIGETTSLEDLFRRIVDMDREVASTMLGRIIKGESKQGSMTILVEDLYGILGWYAIHAIPHEYNSDGTVSVIIGSQKNVTAEHNDNERLKTLVIQNELILNNNNSGFAYITPNFEIEWENISNIYSKVEMVDLFLSMSNKVVGGRLKQITAESIESKITVFRKVTTQNGFVLEIIAHPVLINENEIVGVVLRIDDVTDKEETLLELAIAKENAEKADKLKSAFLANMSHEIRTPLNAIVGFAQLVPEAENEIERQTYIDIINANSEMLLTLINDILDLAKIEAGTLEYNNENFDLVRLFEDLERILKFKVERNVQYQSELPVKQFIVNLDRLRISQVISNFITNAVKFTKFGYIKVGFEILDKGIKLYVEDSGCGMNEEQVKVVFNRFEKFNKFEQGNGLGAAIAKAIVSDYGGVIGVESQVGVGSKFWAIIPLCEV